MIYFFFFFFLGCCAVRTKRGNKNTHPAVRNSRQVPKRRRVLFPPPSPQRPPKTTLPAGDAVVPLTCASREPQPPLRRPQGQHLPVGVPIYRAVGATEGSPRRRIAISELETRARHDRSCRCKADAFVAGRRACAFSKSSEKGY